MAQTEAMPKGGESETLFTLVTFHRNDIEK